jgi:chromosome segregation ATPase
MFKKVAFVGAVGLLTAAVLTQTKVGSYLSHQFDRAEKHFESKIPPEEEVRRIKHEVDNLDKDIAKAKSALANENVEVRNLTTEVSNLRAQTEKSRTAVEARGRQIKEAAEHYIKVDGQSVPVTKAKELLVVEVAAHKNLEKQFKAAETMLGIKQRTRAMAERHLQALITEKAELVTAVAALEADIQMVKAEQVESKYQNDGTRMAKVKQDLAALRKRVEVAQEEIRLSKKFDTTSVEAKSVDEILAGLDAPEKSETARK